MIATPATQQNVDDSSNDETLKVEQHEPAASSQTTANDTNKPVVTVHMNDGEANKVSKFVDNFIRTAKYNVLTFLPMNLFEQFCKVSNFYFLINMIVALVPGVSPVNPASAVLPLVFVITVALIKEGYEDYLRHVADNQANSIEAHVLRPDAEDPSRMTLTTVPSAKLEVGDIIKITTGEEVRADVLLLSSSEAEGAAFIDTCNLDGETNLKNRKAHAATWELCDEGSLASAKLVVKTTPPNPGLLHWVGTISMGASGASTAVGLDQFLYRSAVLRNTGHVWGMVLYAGVDTKMFQNLAEKPRKFSNLDMKLNRVILAVLVIQQVLLMLIAMGSVVWTNQHKDGHWYIKYYLNTRSDGELWGYRYLTYFILLSFMVPISLFVTIELCKVMQAKLMEYDHHMHEWMHGKWVATVANTSNLNEQLSQVRFIFSDKTGTLTENVMKFNLGDVLGFRVESSDLEHGVKAVLLDRNHQQHDAVREYFLALALCHTIQPFPHPPDDPGPHATPLYEGASPDEVALVRAAAEAGFKLLERTVRTITVSLGSTSHDFTILATLEFTPDRKMMSIIVQEPPALGGRIVLYTKGADSFVLPRTNQDDGHRNRAIWPATHSRLAEMAETGLRTLVVCSKVLTQHDFDTWFRRFEEAGTVLTNRSAAVDAVCLEMEDEMAIIGVTAIEDKLQDQVPETIKFFLDAGVVVWMLTGDKRETAVTIAATSSLVDPQHDIVVHVDVETGVDPTSTSPSDVCQKQLQEVWNHCTAQEAMADEGDRKKVTIVIDGVALLHAMEDHPDLFLDVSQRVNSAVCCRLTPLQKANVVKMFQEATGSTALAIGDGANDVSMIQEGRVGVGIVGLEGAQAALAADYAIPRFKHLKRLCCVHGRYALYRNALCVHFSFYKNLTLSMTQMIYAFYCGFSGQTMYDGWLLSFFNFAFSSLPPLTVGMFEKDIAEEPLMTDPKLFTPLHQGLYFNAKTIAIWLGEAVAHAMLLFYLTHPTREEADLHEKQYEGLQLGTLVMTAVVCIVLTKLMLHIKHWILIHVASFAVSIIGFFLFISIYSAIKNLFGYTHFYFSAYEMFGDPKFWFYLLLLVGGLIGIVDLSALFIQRHEIPTVRDTLQASYEARLMMRKAIDASHNAIANRLREPVST